MFQKWLALTHMQQNIIERLIARGGICSLPAQMFGPDPVKADQCIIECFEQCHVKDAIDHWGVPLVLDIIHYRLELIRSAYRIICSELYC